MCVIRITKILGAKVFGPGSGDLANYLELRHQYYTCGPVYSTSMPSVLSHNPDTAGHDDFLFTRTAKIMDTAFDILLGVTLLLGGKVSAKKVLKSAKKGILLGMEVSCTAGHMACPLAKAIIIRDALLKLRRLRGMLEFSELETLIGRLCWLAYYSTFGLRYTLCILALKWLPPAVRRQAFVPGHRMYAELQGAIAWWVELLEGSRVLWCRDHDPKSWVKINSDACLTHLCIHDYTSMFLAKKFDDLDDRIISAKEFEAVNDYLRFAKPNNGKGFLFLCDNMQVCNTIGKMGVSLSTNSKFRAEFTKFAELCESRCYTVVAKYVRSDWNYAADIGSRRMPLLACALAEAVHDTEMVLFLDKPSMNDAIQEILRKS